MGHIVMMSSPEREKDRWFDRISQHLTAIGLIIGGELAVLGIIVGWSAERGFADNEKVILTAIAGGVVFQAHLWLRQLKRDRQIGYDTYMAALNEKGFTNEIARKILEGKPVGPVPFLQHTTNATVNSIKNTEDGKRLDESILVNVFLIFLMFLLRLWK